MTALFRSSHTFAEGNKYVLEVIKNLGFRVKKVDFADVFETVYTGEYSATIMWQGHTPQTKLPSCFRLNLKRSRLAVSTDCAFYSTVCPLHHIKRRSPRLPGVCN